MAIGLRDSYSDPLPRSGSSSEVLPRDVETGPPTPPDGKGRRGNPLATFLSRDAVRSHRTCDPGCQRVQTIAGQRFWLEVTTCFKEDVEPVFAVSMVGFYPPR